MWFGRQHQYSRDYHTQSKYDSYHAIRNLGLHFDSWFTAQIMEKCKYYMWLTVEKCNKSQKNSLEKCNFEEVISTVMRILKSKILLFLMELHPSVILLSTITKD